LKAREERKRARRRRLPSPMAVTILDHPLASDILTALRDKNTAPPEFRRHARRLGCLLVAEALSDMTTDRREVATPLESAVGSVLRQPVAAVAVLRAGLGLLESVLALVPDAAIGFAGVQRDEETAEPMEYYLKFPTLDQAKVLILEPMLATGGSLSWAVDKVEENGADDITAVCVVAAPEGVAFVEENHPSVRIVAASLDEGLTPRFYITPGLGDMGDRLFGTM